MAEDPAVLEAQLEAMRTAFASSERRVRFENREVEFRTTAELAEAISNIERRLVAATGRRVHTVRFSSHKGF